MSSAPTLPWAARLQTHLLHATFSAVSGAVRRVPGWGARADVEVLRDIAYKPGSTLAAHRLDIYRPREGPGPWPLLMYIHGGGFSVCSKETHWMMAQQFAADGFCVANVEYRLAPRHPFPAAFEDVAAAVTWLATHAAAHGADPTRFVLAGESAGANLATGLAMALGAPRPEAYAATLHRLPLRPQAVLAACGLMQVSCPERFTQAHRGLPKVVQGRINSICLGYAPSDGDAPLASPLLALEGDSAPPLPPFLISVGERDPIAEDSRRLHAALRKHGVRAELAVYPHQGHAFHALYWLTAGRAFWHDTFAFLHSCPGLAPQASAGRMPKGTRAH